MNDLGAYVEEGDLGSGGFADVTRAVHIVTKQRVALKKSRTSVDAKERTKREIEVQRLALHANIMRVLDWADDGSWFTMPLAVGDVGQVREQRKGFRDADILRLVEDCAAALGVAHRNGLVHRDLSPRNILWVDDRWVVADWGYVRLPDGANRTPLTNAFSSIGTAPWAAPEALVDGRNVDHRADVYSLGRIVGYLVTNVAPEPNRPTEIGEASPWAKFVRETTAMDRDERPADIYAAVAYLEPVIKTLSTAREATIFAAEEMPDTSRVAVDALKKYLVDPAQRINLRDLITRETEAVHAKLSPTEFSVQTLKNDSIQGRVQRYVDYTMPLISLMVSGCADGENIHDQHWSKMLRRIGEPLGEWGGTTSLLYLRYLPASLLMHAGAIAAVAAERWSTLRVLTRDTPIRNRARDVELPAVVGAAMLDVFDHDEAKKLPGLEKKFFPASEWLFVQLREPLRFLLPSDSDYEAAFFRMEYMLALIYADLSKSNRAPGCLAAVQDSKNRRFKIPTLASRLIEEANGMAGQAGGWASSNGGLFPGGADRAVALIQGLEKQWDSRDWY